MPMTGTRTNLTALYITMMLSIKTIILGLLVSFLALGANAELRHGDKMNAVPVVEERVLQDEDGGAIKDIIAAAMDLGSSISTLCMSSAISDADVKAFCYDVL